MAVRSSDSRSAAGNYDTAKSLNRTLRASPDLVRLMLTALALKNSELCSQGRLLGNRPDLIWYQNQLGRLGVRVNLLQVRHNLKRLCRSGVLVEQTNQCPLRSSLDRILSLRFKMFEYRISTPAKSFFLRVLEPIRVIQRRPVQAIEETKPKRFISRIIFVIKKRFRL